MPLLQKRRRNKWFKVLTRLPHFLQLRFFTSRTLFLTLHINLSHLYSQEQDTPSNNSLARPAISGVSTLKQEPLNGQQLLVNIAHQETLIGTFLPIIVYMARHETSTQNTRIHVIVPTHCNSYMLYQFDIASMRDGQFTMREILQGLEREAWPDPAIQAPTVPRRLVTKLVASVATVSTVSKKSIECIQNLEHGTDCEY